MELLPHMPAEPPARFVSFVERHLAPLRRDAADVVGDVRDADLIYTPVLTDVAARWGWLELLRTRLGQPRAAEAYLSAALARRSRNWQRVDERWQVQVEVWAGDAPPPRAAGPDAPPALAARSWRRSSAAVRLAPNLTPPARLAEVPVVEAAIAWRHAYRASLRRRWIAGAVGAFLLVVFMMRLYEASAP